MLCLLLNATYEPIHVISAQRAICLIYEGKASEVVPSGVVFHSPSTEISVPSVLKLNYYIPVTKVNRLSISRKNVLIRDLYECGYCEDRKGTTIDHIIPRSRGGKHTWENVIACCLQCNLQKGDRLLDEIGWTLRFEPERPIGAVWIYMRASDLNPDWEEFINVSEKKERRTKAKTA